MATKKSNKKKAQPASESKAAAPAQDAKPRASKAVAKKSAGKGGKPGVFTRIRKYFGSVRSEMKRVVWPTKGELVNYSIAVIISLIVVGIVIALLDLLIGEGLMLLAGLRG